MTDSTASLWWLSFVDPHSPKADKALGVAIVGPAGDIVEATRLAHERGCNPGGEVMAWRFPKDIALRVPENICNRLLTRQEAEGLDELLGKKPVEA